jgi:hypothetical protein
MQVTSSLAGMAKAEATAYRSTTCSSFGGPVITSTLPQHDARRA